MLYPSSQSSQSSVRIPLAAQGQSLPAPAPHFSCLLTEAEAKKQARLMKALGDPTRLQILHLLCEHEETISVRELVDCFQLEQPTISHHLRILRDAGIVDCRKQGLWAYYYIEREALTQAKQIIQAITAQPLALR